MASSDQAATRAGGRHGRPWRAAGAAVVVLLAMVGAGMIGASVRTVPPPRPPQPLAQAGPAEPTTAAPDGTATADGAALPDGTDTGTQAPADAGPTGRPDPDTAPAVVALPRSAPTTISIPRIGVNAEIMSLGTNPDGTVQVPPLDQAMKAGWYSPGASPGEAGNAVIVGHVDSAKLGPAVFFDLGSLQPGDTIAVARADGSAATFRVDEVKSYPKTAFPTELVYGPNDKPGLRVVTCGGTFDRSAGSYLDNIVVLATMTA
ncbi:class F sortase [Micromonospora auratinigra]|uniref:Sortase family protein n=1 Tax=Micromonospora auratinigra TaxID=261654 RepID=A0A1A8ZRR8_9ACTN|nr:class F sortase [Micromonospora auratinigra]SBT46583.1 Sortase family protein [Micromonospora auratinigra]